MPIYRLDPNPNRISYGTTIGILQSNGRIPMAPGDIGNASTFNFPVVYRVVEEATFERLIVQSDPALAQPLIREARSLQQSGVSAIMGDCGHMLRFQEEVAEAVNIPVFLSSWLQVPFIKRILPTHKTIGVLMANSCFFRLDHLKYAGLDPNTPLVIVGMQDSPAFHSAFIDEEGELDTDAVEDEIVSVAKNLYQEHPNIGSIFLECSDMPPYASAIQDALHLPVFDFVTMVNYVYAAFTRTRFHGTYY
jgi:aspartate/glutamate racemase